MRTSVLVVFIALGLIVLFVQVPESDAIYAYAIKGFVKDVRHQPLRFIGGLFFKKAFILKKLKLKWKIKKKIILKKLLKKLFGHGHGRKKRNSGYFQQDEIPGYHDHQQQHEDHQYPEQKYDENTQQYYPQQIQDQEPKDSDIMEYLSMANEFDSSSCIAKGICEIMSRGNRTGNQFENSILDYYTNESVERPDTTGTPAYIYDYAAFLGKSTRNSGSCSSYFPNCSEPPQVLNNFMNEVFVSEMCDAPVSNYA